MHAILYSFWYVQKVEITDCCIRGVLQNRPDILARKPAVFGYMQLVPTSESHKVYGPPIKQNRSDRYEFWAINIVWHCWSAGCKPLIYAVIMCPSAFQRLCIHILIWFPQKPDGGIFLRSHVAFCDFIGPYNLILSDK